VSDSEYPLSTPELQAERLPKQSSSQVTQDFPSEFYVAALRSTVMDPLRREFISECLNHVQRLAFMADRAICIGQDPLYETQIEMMRSVMREALKTYKEMKDAE
jgi:hypothetical protein